MVLTPGSLFESDATGTSETITLKPVPPATSTQATISSAFYGTDSQGASTQVPVTGGTSVTITVLSGMNQLVLNLISPNPRDESVQITQGTTVLANPTIRQHSGSSTIFIKGT
jgi:hypothetical protein